MNGPKEIKMSQLCKNHSSLLVHGAGYAKTEPWQALIIAAQIALFQAATLNPRTHERTEGDLANLHRLGCLGCLSPAHFGEIVEVAKQKELGAIKRLGERWVEEAKRQEAT